jgi:hypothetical protein
MVYGCNKSMVMIMTMIMIIDKIIFVLGCKLWSFAITQSRLEPAHVTQCRSTPITEPVTMTVRLKISKKITRNLRISGKYGSLNRNKFLVRNTNHFRGYKLTFIDWFKFRLIEELPLTYHLRFIPEGVAEVSQIFLRDTHVCEEHCRRDRW